MKRARAAVFGVPVPCGAIRRIVVLGVAIAGFAVLCVPAARAQQDPISGPEKGSNELEVWTGAGHGVKGEERDSTIWNLGLRYGWVLTDPHGPGLLRGRFEFAVDVIPIFWVFRPDQTAYGFSVDPFALKWNFATKPSRRVRPYFEVGGGALFTNVQVPAGTSRVNFTTAGALGLHFLRGRYAWSTEIRFMHISDAGISSVNPGINTLQGRLGFGLFTRPK